MSSGNGNCVVQDLPVAELIVDPRVNTRPVNYGRVQGMASDFDLDSLGVLHVSIRPDGTKSLVDGNHRRLTLERIGWTDQRVPCRIYTGLSVAQEARLFDRPNDTRKPSRIARYMARLTGEHKETLAINAIVRAVGLAVHDAPGTGHIQCVAVLEALYKGDTKIAKRPDPRCILHALECLRDAWGPDSTSFKGPLVHGLGLVFLREGDRVKKSHMIAKLTGVVGGAAGLEARAKTAKDMHNRSLPFSAAGVIVDLYNKSQGVKARLQSWWS